MNMLCEGRVVIVTGGARGIGREYSLMLAAHGAKVVVNDLGGAPDGSSPDATPAQVVANEIKSNGGEAIANGEDISNWAAAKRMVQQAIDTFGKLDVVINNAGILRDRMFVNMSEQEFDDVIRVHLKGTFAPSHHAAQYWRDLSKSTGKPVKARIINTTSNSGIYGNAGQTNYGAAKMGIAAFTIIASQELARYGITVNAISPIAETRLTAGLRERTPEQIVQRHPRWIAPVVTWLASERSSDVTGRIFETGGGVLAVAEGWVRGPEAAPREKPDAELEKLLLSLVSKARKNSSAFTGKPQD